MITFDVDYYNAGEEQLFQRAGLASRFSTLIASGLTIDELDLRALGMFNEQHDRNGFRTKHELRERAMERNSQFRDYFAVTNGCLSSRVPPMQMAPGTTESMGVAASLAAMNDAFGLHDADWVKLPVGKQKNLDFRVAATSTHYVVVESKGAIVDDVSKKGGSIPGHKLDIKEKKKEQRPLCPRTTLVGTVTAIPSPGSSQRSRIWLIDPEAPEIDRKPRDFKIRQRLRYYRDLMALVGRPRILVALSNRLAVFDASTNIELFNGVPLLDSGGRKYGIPPSFTAQRSHSTDEQFVVATIVVKEGLLLVGLDLNVLTIVAGQEFDRLINWNSNRERRVVEFALMLDKEELKAINKLATGDKQRSVTVKCSVSIGASGLIYGVVRRE